MQQLSQEEHAMLNLMELLGSGRCSADFVFVRCTRRQRSADRAVFKYREGALELATEGSGKSGSGATGFAGWQADASRSSDE